MPGGAMPRYFFNLRNDGFVPDMVGRELASDDAARTVAWEVACLMPKGSDGGPKAILVVVDANGRTVCEVQILG
jgi:uncharacterized protein DUF6894